jgi:hypothetical protein
LAISLQLSRQTYTDIDIKNANDTVPRINTITCDAIVITLSNVILSSFRGSTPSSLLACRIICTTARIVLKVEIKQNAMSTNPFASNMLRVVPALHLPAALFISEFTGDS